MHALQPLAQALLATLRDMAPILATIALFQGLVLGVWPDDPVGLLAGLLAILIGLTLLVRGLERSLFPIGEALAEAMARRGHPALLMGFAFALGFGSTVASPHWRPLPRRRQVPWSPIPISRQPRRNWHPLPCRSATVWRSGWALR